MRRGSGDLALGSVDISFPGLTKIIYAAALERSQTFTKLLPSVILGTVIHGT